jgi:hypothetical protein
VRRRHLSCAEVLSLLDRTSRRRACRRALSHLRSGCFKCQELLATFVMGAIGAHEVEAECEPTGGPTRFSVVQGADREGDGIGGRSGLIRSDRPPVFSRGPASTQASCGSPLLRPVDSQRPTAGPFSPKEEGSLGSRTTRAVWRGDEP